MLSGRIAPDVSKYRNAAFFSVKLDPEKRRRHYDPSKCQEPLTHKTWKAGELHRDTVDLLRVFLCHVELPHSHVFHQAVWLSKGGSWLLSLELKAYEL